MIGRTHLAAGFCTGAAISAIAGLSEVEMVLVTAGSMVGALFPDIDQKHSTISQAVKPVGVVVSTVLGHRKLLHDPVCYIIALIMLYFGAPQYNLGTGAIVAGIFSHLFLDSLNAKGVPLLYLLKHGKWRLRLSKIKTGGFLDKTFGTCLTCAGWVFMWIWWTKVR